MRLELISILVSLSLIFIQITFVVAEEENTINIPAGAYSPLCEPRDRCYEPSHLTIETGSKVTWVNQDYAIHTVTSGTIWFGPNKLFHSKILDTNEEFEFIFKDFESSTYPYYCQVHPWMKGVITVIGKPQSSSHE